ncbi:MAG: ferredoxin family protein [Planktomarina sp.]|nr:ferredoxin family protein [Planktomarina sp.]|tara:strand:+ start:964 stop:1311 length:348 start_codon:yes stop_codon:yes gene_type:complete
MSYVIIEECVDIKDGVCTQVCPVNCIYEGGRMFYIHPEECVKCGLCESICPVDAIRVITEVTPEEQRYVLINKEFFEDKVTGWGRPDGWSSEFTTDLDHPDIAVMPLRNREKSYE